MIDLFTPGRLGRLTLKNRLVRSAVWEALADDDGFVTGPLVDRLRELAAGGVGLIILGYSYVQPNGKQSPGQTAIWSDAYISGMKRLTDAVHDEGGRISIQLVHCGPQTTPEAIGGETPVGAGAIEHGKFGTPRELSTEEVVEVIGDFGHAARRSVLAGFDAVQIHGAHGYLVSQFISPLWNRRIDEFGGSLEGRMRFATRVYRSVRENAADLPVFIKLNVSDYLEGSTTPEDSLPLAARLSELGIDGIEVSAGGALSEKSLPARTRIRKPEQEGYLMDLVRLTRARTRCAIIGMGGFRSPDTIDSVLASGEVDFVSMARPLIREPGLVNRWRRGDRSSARCLSCNGCFKTVEYGAGIQCFVDHRSRAKAAGERR